MKKMILPIIAVFFSLAITAQTKVLLQFNHQLGDQAFAIDAPAEADGYSIKVERLEYYVSEIKIHHDGGQTTEIGHLWLLVNPALDTGGYLLGGIQAENIEGITFSIGVDSAHNHLDPAGYPAGHPLAPQNPSMHWGWVAGYRFIAFEGSAGANFAYNFEIHSIGDELYRTVTLPVIAEQEAGGFVIPVNADYTNLLKNIDASGGVISHGGLNEAKQIMENIGTVVFSSGSLSGAANPVATSSLEVFPNPAAGGFAWANFDLPAGYDYELAGTDLTGRVLSSQKLGISQGTTQLEAPGTGMYLVQLRQNGKPIAHKKWLVVK